MALKCLGCGAYFDETEIHYWEERHGFTYGLFEKFSGSPCCQEGYTDADEC